MTDDSIVGDGNSLYTLWLTIRLLEMDIVCIPYESESVYPMTDDSVVGDGHSLCTLWLAIRLLEMDIVCVPYG